ncbi:hypothetical protein SRHO_G00269950 [Serrasalmus rhombeus]
MVRQLDLSEDTSPAIPQDGEQAPAAVSSSPSPAPSHHSDSDLTDADTTLGMTTKGKKPKLSHQFRSSPVFAVLSDFQEFYASVQASQKNLENAQLRKSHATCFVLHMHRLSESSRLDSFTFLFHYGHIRSWQVSLVKQGYAVTSVKIMILNASAFHSEMSGLTNSQFDQILMQLKRLQKDNARRIKAHQQTVRREKSTKLQRQPICHSLRLLHGYLSGYLAIISGYRPVVFLNLGKAHLDQAELDGQNRALIWVSRQTQDRPCIWERLPHSEPSRSQLATKFGRRLGPVRRRLCDYVFQYNGNQLTKKCEELRATWQDARMPGRISFGLIRTLISNQVDKHKTDRAYGNTYLALNHREVSWLRSLVDVSVQFGGDRCDYVFQNNGNQLTKICEELRAAWRDTRMPGRISFGLIRTSISNQVDKHKTDHAYGNTCLALNHREVSWLRSLVDVSVQFGGDRCDYVFQYNGNQLTKICEELRAAWRDAQMPGHISFSLIRTSISNQVDKHKTDHAYGNTCLALNHREVSWLRSLVDVSVQFGGDHCDYVFQYNGNQLTKICEELRAAWRDAQMPGHISFSLIRTSISNQVDKHKTDRAYGNTCHALNHREVSWLRSLVDVSVQFGGDRCDYVFQYNGNQLTKICEELRAAWRDAQMPGRISFSLIRTSISNQVDKHKTDRAYGNTCLALNHREVSWLRSLVDVSVQFGGDRCDYVFQYNGNQLTKICEELRAAWRDAQMPGRISFSLIRTSISNQFRGVRCDYVFQNNGNQLTKICEELRAAWRDARMPGRISFGLIRTSISNQVDKHKTDRAYGNTCLALNHREVSWLRSLVDVSVQFGGDRCDYVFQYNGNQLTKICEELRAA